jgi:Flp pilus assembly protein CpaB
VLSLGGDASQNEKRRPGVTANQTTITLDVSTQDALKIQTARQMGRLSLMLRNDVDHKAVDTTVITADDFNARENRNSQKPAVCTRGTMRMGNISYIVNCDGTMVQLKE